MIRHPRLAQRLLNRPLALAPSHLPAVLQLLRSEAPAALLAPEQAAPQSRAFDQVGPVALIPVTGCLVHGDAAWWWDETSYSRIRRAFAEAVGDPEVRAIALHVDSPGGEVAGCFDLADAIFAARGSKPIWAILDEGAYSAAYALASAADRITAPRTGGAGSIGVVLMHLDITRALDEAGVTITTLQYGARKTDSYPTTPLSDPARERLQAEVDAMGELFVETVARNRGLAAGKVRETEAGCLLAADAVAAGLVDEVLSPDAAFLALLATLD